MTDFHAGWAPAGRIRRPVALPEELDQKVSVLARANHTTPARYVSNVLGQAVNANFHPTPSDIGPVEPERRVQRIVALDRSVYSALSDCISNSELAFSDLAAAIVGEAIEHSGNGHGVNGNGVNGST